MKRSLNLLSERSRNRNVVRHGLRVWLKVVAVSFALATVVCAAQWYACHRIQSKTQLAEIEYEPLRQLKIDNTRLKKEIANLRQAEVIPLRLSEHQPLLGIVGLTTKAIANQQSQLFLNQIEIDREPLKLDSAEQTALTVGLEGIASDQDSANQFADYLRTLGPFSNVALTINNLPVVGNTRPLAFSIECANFRAAERKE